jgi:hypothetical protein
MASTHDIEFSLLDNAIDSLTQAIDLLAWEGAATNNSKLKQSIQLTGHAVELLLKERLRRIHPSLIWEDVDKYPRLDARTVGVDRAISRLENIGNIKLATVDADVIRSLRNTRNAIEHFRWSTTTAEANQIIGQGLSFAIEFANSQLDMDIGYRFRSDDTWEMLLSKNDAFVRAHGARTQQKLESEGRPAQECSFCNAVAQDLSTGACSLCGHWERLDDDEDDIPF